jgi:hypothetical protein
MEFNHYNYRLYLVAKISIGCISSDCVYTICAVERCFVDDLARLFGWV